MANKRKNSKNRSSHEKRISKAAPKSSQEKQKVIDEERAERERLAKKKATAQRGKKIAAVVFSVLLILAFAIPSLTALSTCSQNNQSTASSSEGYEQIIAGFESELAADPIKTSAYYSIGNAYYEWAEAVRNGTVTYADGEKGLYQKAIANYESYLAAGEANADATISLALSYYYTGDGSKAVELLKTLTEQQPDNAMAWARLGFVYSYTGDNDNAIVACNKAIELDPNDAVGAKTAASQLLSEIQK